MADPAVEWLLSSTDPSIRYLTLVDILGESARSKDGGFGVHPYHKWTGAHWRLVSLIELGVPSGDPKIRLAANQVLDWLDSNRGTNWVAGRARIHASIHGNALAVSSRLGMSRDKRVQRLGGLLLETQWPDGGWNCDQKPEASHSSFYESLATLWGLIEYSKATGNGDVSQAADRVAEFFLGHELFRSTSSREVIDPKWLNLHYPLYWHYDILQALLILSRAEKLADSRANEALDIIESKRDRHGLWRSQGYFWRPIASSKPISSGDAPNKEVVDWGRRGPNEMITLNALRVLRAAGRL